MQGKQGDGTQAAPSSGSGYTALLVLGAYRKRILQKLGHHDWRAGTRGLHDDWRRAADDERRGLCAFIAVSHYINAVSLTAGFVFVVKVGD